MAVTDMVLDKLAAILGSLTPDEERELRAMTRARRQQRRQAERDAALRIVREEFFAELDCLPAAIEIDLAVRGLRTVRSDTEKARSAAAKRAAACRRLKELLGDLSDVPGRYRIRQILPPRRK